MASGTPANTHTHARTDTYTSAAAIPQVLWVIHHDLFPSFGVVEVVATDTMITRRNTSHDALKSWGVYVCVVVGERESLLICAVSQSCWRARGLD